MTGLNVAQYQAAASSTLLTVTQKAWENLDTLSHEDIRKWMGRGNSRIEASLKDRSLKEISLEIAANINAHAQRDIFELAPEHIVKIFVQKSAITQLRKLKLDDDIGKISTQIKKLNPVLSKEQIYQYLYRWINAMGEENYTVGIKYGIALEDYFSKNYKIKLFEIETLFYETVKFKKRQFLSLANPGKKSSASKMQSKRPREYQEKIPKNRSSKRTKFSNGTSNHQNHHLQGLSSIPSQIPFVEQTPYQEAESTALNFNQDDQSHLRLSDFLPSGNGLFNVSVALIPPLPPQAIKETVPFYNQEQQVSDLLPEWNGYNTMGVAFIQPPDTNETGENVPFYNQEQQVSVPLSDSIPGDYFPDLNSTSNNASQFVKITSYEPESLTLNFNQDEQSWLSDPLTSGNGFNTDEVYYLQPPDTNETGENAPSLNVEPSIDPLWDPVAQFNEAQIGMGPPKS